MTREEAAAKARQAKAAKPSAVLDREAPGAARMFPQEEPEPVGTVLSETDYAAVKRELDELRAQMANTETEVQRYRQQRAVGWPGPLPVDPEDRYGRLQDPNGIPRDPNELADLQIFNTEERRKAGVVSHVDYRTSHTGGGPPVGYRATGAGKSAGTGISFQAAEEVWMYTLGGEARAVRRANIDHAMHDGLFPNCPRCLGFHPESETNPNACPKTVHVKYTKCAICAANGTERFIYDTQIQALAMSDDNPDYVQLESGDPVSNLQVRYDDHIRQAHISTAAARKMQPWERAK